MADTFGQAPNSRLQSTGGRFYATPAANVAANAVFMPKYASSPFFGIAEYPVEAGKLGAFAREGVFAFDIPEGFTSSVGQPIYYAPTSGVAGTLSASPSSGAVRLGYEVEMPDISGKLCVFIDPGDALETVAPSGGGGGGGGNT